MKKSLIAVGLLLAGTSAVASESYQTVGFSRIHTSGDFVSSTSSKSFSLNRNLLNYSLYKPSYIIKASYSMMPNQTLYSSKTSNNSPYDRKRKASGFGVTYIPKFYIKDSIFVAPIITLKRVKSETYSHMSVPGTYWVSTRTADTTTTSRTDTDLSLDVMIAKEYKQYSSAYAVLSLVNDLAFKDNDDDERDNFTLTVGAEHYLQDNWRIVGNISKFLTDKKADSKWYATENLISINLGVDYKF